MTAVRLNPGRVRQSSGRIADFGHATRGRGHPAGLQVTRAVLVGDLRGQLAQALAYGRKNAFGSPWAACNTAPHSRTAMRPCAGAAIDPGGHEPARVRASVT